MSPEPPKHQPDDVVKTSSNARYNAASLQYMSWAHLFDGLIKAYGSERVREKLESELDRIRLGFHIFPLESLWLEEAKPVLATVAARLAQRGRMSMMLIDGPAVPPLDGLPADMPKQGRPAKTGTGKRSSQ